jgi:hypothetical protein
MSGLDRSKRAPHKEFFGLPWRLVRHPHFIRLSPKAKQLIIDLRCQYTGFNNGNLTATWRRMKTRGWRSPDTLHNALGELSYYGFVVRTIQGRGVVGGVPFPNLYALTWEPLHDCGKGYAGTAVPSNDWERDRPPWRPKQRIKKS